MKSELIKKYNVAGPRYTSYPTVPYWDHSLTEKKWKEAVQSTFRQSNRTDGMSLYIHLPFCESLCTYCGCNTRITTNHSVEKIYLTAVQEEWRMYLDLFAEIPQIKEIHVGGGTPTFFSPQHLEQLLSKIISSGTVNPGAEFGFEAHPANTSIGHLRTLYDLGFRRLSLGIQDFDLKVQEIVNRHQSFESVKNVTESARDIGYTSVNFDLIYGLPMQSISRMPDTINKVIDLRPDRIAFYSYAHVPWIKPGQRKFTEKDLPGDEEKRMLYETGRRMLEEAGYIEIGMDHFALANDPLNLAAQNGKLHRNFMGYTSSHTRLLIGLGVSAIGDAWNAYAQNIKSVDEYYEKIHEGHLPLFRGHLLNEEDLILRTHISNIMCRRETNWSDAENQHYIEQALQSLEEMEADGLITISPFHLKITAEGKAFIRNVCMAFDARLRRKIPQTQIFSKVI